MERFFGQRGVCNTLYHAVKITVNYTWKGLES